MSIDAAKKAEPALLLDGMTSLQYVPNELYKFQEATRCDTADELPAPQPAIPEWQPIETAPKDGTDILVMYIHIDTQIVHNAFWNDYEDAEEEEIGWWSYEHSEVSRIKLDDWMTPTHWMPLPAAPKKEKSDVPSI